MPKNKAKLVAAPKLSRELFLPGLFIVRIKAHISSVGLMKYSEMSVMSSDFTRFPKFCDLSQSALPNIHSVLSASPQVVCCAPNSVCTVCMSVYKHACTCQVCIKASSIQLTLEKEMPSSESTQRRTPLYRCEYILFLCKNVYKCIHRHPMVSGPVSVMYRFFFFFKHTGFRFSHSCHEPHEAFYLYQSEE